MFSLATVDLRSQHCRTPRNMHGTFVHTVCIHPDSTPARPPAHAYSHTCTHTYSHPRMHAHAHTLAHVHAHAYM